MRFPERNPDCRVVELNVNHRSHATIIRAFTDWMRSADWSNPDPEGRPFRYDKTVTPAVSEGDDYPAIIRIDGNGPVDEADQLIRLLRFLKRNRVITDYSQVALLLHSVREEVAGRYLDALDDADIPAGIPRAGAGTGRRLGRRELAITTIHRSKGLEWDVVVVGSLAFHNRDVDPVGRVLLPHAGRRVLEPSGRIAAFDHMRQHYVGFSRARHLLALTAGELPRARFDPIWDEAEAWDGMSPARRQALARQRFTTGEVDAPLGRDAQLARDAPPPSPRQRLSELRPKRIVVHLGRSNRFVSPRAPAS